MGSTHGIHVVWTTYGTWLPGDARGHWSPLLDLYGWLRQRGHRLNEADRATAARARSLMKQPAKRLTDDEIHIVASVIGHQLSPGMPGATWKVLSAAIEPTHVHLLFAALTDDIGTVVGRIKSQTSSALIKHPSNRDRSRIWTAGYWKVFLFDDDAVHAVQQYIERHNQRRGLSARPWDWIENT
jgi:REP element-mobilizing transposase RayT